MARRAKPVEAHQADGTRSEVGKKRVAGTRKRVAGSRPTPSTPLLVAGRSPFVVPDGVKADGPVGKAMLAIAALLERILDAADAPLVEACARSFVRMRTAGDDVDARGQLLMVTKYGRNGESWEDEQVNPSMMLERQATAQFRLMCEQLGIGPSARARLAAMGDEGRDVEDEFDELAELRERRASG